ncbi:MAG: preprotein translocase subunit SecA [Actinomycetia bacterium]|nr:preprotein translocase subunit SecA [Actinomycetes bacterium]
MTQDLGSLEKFLRFGEGRRLRQLADQADYVGSLEAEFEALSDAELMAKTAEFRQRHENGETLEELVFEAFAAVREASKRTIGLRHFPVQVMGAIVLHEGDIAEMKTGEGKTLVATMPLFLNSLSGHNVHLVTVNDYLAKRDAEWMGPIYEVLGVRVAFIRNMMPYSERKAAYAADITYGTNSEFGFDYLRDNMAVATENTVQRGHAYAIVDEVDSILVDEARTPLIISGEPETAAKTYYDFARIARELKGTPAKFVPRGMPKPDDDADYEFDEKFKTVSPREGAIEKVERMLGIDNLYDPRNAQLVNHLIQALKADSLYHLDDDYVVIDGEVKIVDEFTGRIMEGRRWSEGLHQAVEAKERVPIKEEHVTLATITLQNYFRLYEKLAGMTGTAKTEEKEFQEIYDLSVVEIPTNVPVVRADENDLIFKSKQARYDAVIADIQERHELGQPVLVGTISVEVSEYLSHLLDREGIPHNVLNAKQHEREAEIIIDAGERGAVTIATNMAGRGVDIKIDDHVRELGGLYVLGTERHESRRIDNQLRGRSGRQGDPGESRFYLSAEDELVRLFAGDRIYRIIDRFKLPDDEPMEAAILTKQIETAQKKVEEQNFVTRKNVLKYDDVMNTQRKVIYEQRSKVLAGEDLGEDMYGWIDAAVERVVQDHTEGDYGDDWDIDGLFTAMANLYDTEILPGDVDFKTISREEIIGEFREDARDAYDAREEELGAELMRQIERYLVLQTVDARWRGHLESMDYLREGIHLRGLAQKDPLAEYRGEGHVMFEQLNGSIKEEVVRNLFRVQIEVEDADELEPEAEEEDILVYEHESVAGSEAIAAAGSATAVAASGTLAATGATATAATATAGAAATQTGRGGSAKTSGRSSAGGGAATKEVRPGQRVTGKKVGRNDPCPCGSGKKYKRCHGA